VSHRGDWDLEFRVGRIDASALSSTGVLQDWQGSLKEIVIAKSTYTPSFLYETTIDADNPVGQQFQYNSGFGAYSLDTVELLIKNVSNATGEVTVSIREAWGGTVLSTVTISATELASDYAWHQFDLPETALDDEVTYVLMVETTAPAETISIRESAGNPYRILEPYDPVNDIVPEISVAKLNSAGTPVPDRDLLFKISDQDSSLLTNSLTATQDSFIRTQFLSSNTNYGTLPTLKLDGIWI